MKTHYSESTIVIELREDQAADVIASGYGRAVPYATPTMLGGYSESFEPEAFDPADVIGKPFAYRHGEPIGIITDAENQPDGLYVHFDLVNTAQGRDAATLMRTGASKGLSVGFTPVKSAWNKTKDHVKHLKAGLLEVSQTHMPAYSTAGVSAIREEQPMPEATEAEATQAAAVDVEAREAIASVREEISAISARAFSDAPLDTHFSQFRSFGHYAQAVFRGEIENRALDVSNLADAPGLVPPVWLRDIKGVLDRGRPCINALGGAVAVGGAGLTVNWPYFDGDLSAIVATQASENTEINSADIDIKKGTATLATYAAGNRLTFQVIERTDPSYVDAHQRIMLGAYGTETDYAFQAAMWTNGTNGVDYDFSADTTGAVFREAVFAAAVDVEYATGQPAEVVLVNSAVFKKIGGWSTFMPDVYGTSNVSGTFNGATLRLSVAGLPIVLARAFATDETQDAIVTNRASIQWLEDGPRLASVDQVANLGRDYAIYGYATAAAYMAGGIVKIYNQV